MSVLFFFCFVQDSYYEHSNQQRLQMWHSSLLLIILIEFILVICPYLEAGLLGSIQNRGQANSTIAIGDNKYLSDLRRKIGFGK